VYRSQLVRAQVRVDELCKGVGLYEVIEQLLVEEQD
jgi:hypothetical protein